MNLSGNKSWGKLVGGVLGLWVGGPFGAVAGLILGHLHDTKPPTPPSDSWSGLWSSYGDFSANVEQAAFLMGVVVLGAKMAKADGRVTSAEIEAFKRVFHVGPPQEAAVGRLFDRARLSAEGFEPYAAQLAHVFRNKQPVLEEILGGLFIIAAADHAGLSPAEIIFLKRVAFIFGFTAEDFARIAARSGVRIPQPERPQNPIADAHAILGIKDTSTNDEIKSAYRALIREHHPDKLMAAGMPPEFVASATEKMKRINAAYDTVCKLRGIK
jgi:DnaJ like chaperone protein